MMKHNRCVYLPFQKAAIFHAHGFQRNVVLDDIQLINSNQNWLMITDSEGINLIMAEQ